jgi:addiction module HigA family antidote
MSASKYLPLIHPGEILLEEFIKPMGLSLAFVSRSTGIPASRLTEITKCRRGISAETALRLAKFFGTSAAFWMGLQSEHDLELAERTLGVRAFCSNLQPVLGFKCGKFAASPGLGKTAEDFVHGCVLAQSWMSIHSIATPCPSQNLLAAPATPFRKMLQGRARGGAYGIVSSAD